MATLTTRGRNANKATKLPGLQASRAGDPAVRAEIDALREHVEVRLGSRGDMFERAVTFRDLAAALEELRVLIAAVSGGTATADSTDLTVVYAQISALRASLAQLDVDTDAGLAQLAAQITAGVTSVAATVPSFLSVSGSPITSTGTLAVSYSGTALPVANGGTGITSFGSGIATWLGTPSSANLRSAVTDETGTGVLVFATSPTLVTPLLGTPTSGVLTNCTGLPVAGGGTGVTTVNALRALLGEKTQVLTDAATVAVDASLGNNCRVTLGGNRTLGNPTNLIDGQVLNFRIKQDGTGTRTLAYSSKYDFPGGTAPVLSTAAGALDFMSCQYDATDDTLNCVLNQAFA